MRRPDAPRPANVVASTPAISAPPRSKSCSATPQQGPHRLGWHPTTTFPELVSGDGQADLHDAQRDHLCQTKGFRTFDFHEYKKMGAAPDPGRALPCTRWGKSFPQHPLVGGTGGVCR